MIKYLNEEDNIEMDVQVGPHDEIDVSAEPEEAAPTQSMNPVDVAKSVPENIPVAAVHCDDKNDAGNEEKLEFYVDARDVEKFADLNEFTMIDALNAIIHCHEEAGMRADNLVVVVGESTANYARNLEKHGGAYMFVHEADDISIDVQVGPNGEDMQVDADPQEANPVDAVKRDYGSVVVAKQGDEFFTDVEDVQKCAELNCESVIDTLNGIIKVNEADCDISAQNLRVIVNEGTSEEIIKRFQENNVIFYLDESGVLLEGAIPEREIILKKAAKITTSFLRAYGAPRAQMSKFYIGGRNKQFVNGTADTLLIGIARKTDLTDIGNILGILLGGSYTANASRHDENKDYDNLKECIKIVRDYKNDLKKELEEGLEKKVKNIKVADGRLGVTNIEITLEF